MKVKAFIWGVIVNLILSFFLSLIVGIATNIYNAPDECFYLHW